MLYHDIDAYPSVRLSTFLFHLTETCYYRAYSFLPIVGFKVLDQQTKLQCLIADSLRPSQQFFSHVRKGLPGLKTVLSIG